jgi:23S rRNA (guanosine2251-2'-O)-methyltransferase
MRAIGWREAERISVDRRGPDRRPAAGWRQKPRGPRREAASPLSGDAEPILIYGLHAVSEALANPRREITRLLVTENALRRLEDKARSRLQPEMVGPHDIARLLPPDAVHQGIMAEALPLIAPELDDLAEDGMVLALDQITDPHNVGAILRTASAFAVKAVIVPMRHSPAATGVLAKAASGALVALAERGFLRVGLDSEGEGTLEEAALRAPLVLALGAEGKGLRDRVRQSCDLVVRIDLPGAIKSLNVSNAAAIALSVIHRRIANSE